jgi:hypothetical protein
VFEDKMVARDVSELMLEIGKKLDASLAHAQKSGSVAEFERYRDVVGQVMGEILLEVMNPIYSRHPELKPPELD